MGQYFNANGEVKSIELLVSGDVGGRLAGYPASYQCGERGCIRGCEGLPQAGVQTYPVKRQGMSQQDFGLEAGFFDAVASELTRRLIQRLAPRYPTFASRRFA